MTIGLASAVVAIATILFAANVTIINAQQLTNQPAISQNGIRSFESAEDSFRVQVPEGWIIHNVNNTGLALSDESTQGYGILAQLCPQEQQRQQQAAIPNASSNSSDTLSSCDQSENDIIHIVRYPDLDNRLQIRNNDNTTATTSSNNNNNNIIVTNDNNILLYHIQKLEQVGYRDIEIVNSTDRLINLIDPQTNQTIQTMPAKFVEMTYSTASTPRVIREGYFVLTATNATQPNVGMTKGYSIFYEGPSTTAADAQEQTRTTTRAATAASVSSAPVIRPSPAVVQVFNSFELIAAPDVAQDMLAAQSEQEGEDATSLLTVDITSSDTEGEDATAPATFEFEADVVGGTGPYTYRWDFDDDVGSSEEGSDEQTVSHTFEEAGTYNVRLTVTDSSGQSASDSIEITVEEPATAAAPAEEEEVVEEEEEEVVAEEEQPVEEQQQAAEEQEEEEQPIEEQQQAAEEQEEEDNNSGSDDLIDVDEFLDDLFDRLGLR
jgi:PKD repeat protein